MIRDSAAKPALAIDNWKTVHHRSQGQLYNTTGNNQETTDNQHKYGKSTPTNWAEIVKGGTPKNSEIPAGLRDKRMRTKKLLEKQNTIIQNQPDPVGVYFKNDRRGPIGILRRALRESLPAWALLGIGFVGGSVLEVVTDRRMKPRLIATLHLMGILELPNFDIFTNATKKSTNNHRPLGDDRNLEMAQKRLEPYAIVTRNPYAK